MKKIALIFIYIIDLILVYSFFQTVYSFFGGFKDIASGLSQTQYKILISSLTFSAVLSSLSFNASKATKIDVKQKAYYKVGELFFQSTIMLIFALMLGYYKNDYFLPHFPISIFLSGFFFILTVFQLIPALFIVHKLLWVSNSPFKDNIELKE